MHGPPAPDWLGLGRVADALARESTPERVVAVAADEARRLLRPGVLVIWLSDPASRELVPVVGCPPTGPEREESGRRSPSASPGPIRAAATGRPVEISDPSAAAAAMGMAATAVPAGLGALLLAPMAGLGRLVGVLGYAPIDPTGPHPLTDDERAAVRVLADLCAVAVENARRLDALRAAEEGSRLAVQATTDVVWDWDRSTGRVVWNDQLERAFGWRADEPGAVLAESLSWLIERVHPDDRDRVRAALDGAVAGRRDAWRVEYRLRRRDGSYGVVLDRGLLVRGPDGATARVVSTLRDISRRKQVEDEQRFLAEASRVLASSLDYETTLRSVAELAIPELADWCAVDLLDEQGGARAVAGAHRDPSLEPRLHEMQRRYGPTNADARPVARALRTGRSVLLPEVSAQELTGTSVDADHTALRRAVGFSSLLVAPLLVGGRTLGAITLARGPDRSRYEPEDLPAVEELARRCAVAIDNARLYADAQAAIQARDQFLSIAAHELRTPLTGIKGHVQVLHRAVQRGRLEPERLARGLIGLNAASDRLGRLISDLLDVGRARTGRVELRLEEIDLATLAAEVGQRLWETLDGRHRLVFGAPGAPCLAMLDRDRIEQVLLNLLENAVKYSPEGGEVGLTLRREGDSWAVEVRDQGIGLPCGAAEVLFTPFGRAANATARHLPGMGLGLYISRSIVERHGGRIWAESPGDGGGTTFHVRLPLRPPGSAGAEDATSPD